MAEHEDGPNDLRTPFVFVPHGAPEPAEFISTLGEVLRIPATLRPDPPPRSLHPDAALPTGTPTTRARAGTPAALGALVPGRRQHTRFPRSKYPPRVNESHQYINPVTEYLRSSQIMDAAARAYAAPETAPATSFQSTAAILETADEVTSQAHAAIRLLQQRASSPIRLASEEPPETDEETGSQGRPLSPQDEINRVEYNVAFDALEKLDPNNPALTTLTGPDYVPSDAAIAHVREVLARVQRQGPDTAADEKADKRPSTQLMLPGEPLMDQLRHPPKFELEPRPQDVEKPAATSVPPIVSPRE